MVLKRRFIFGMMVLLLLTGSARAMESLGEVPVEEYIRLHVVAEDDSEAAQALKLKVRDACLEATRALLSDCESADEAWALVGENVETLEEVAQLAARQSGYDGPVEAWAGVFDFPDRRYGSLFVPAGEYRALRVVIGAGAGHNWWCVLYPSLCLTEDVAPGEPVAFHSTLLDWLRSIFGGEG